MFQSYEERLLGGRYQHLRVNSLKTEIIFKLKVILALHSQCVPLSVCKLTWIALKVNVFHYQQLNRLQTFSLCCTMT